MQMPARFGKYILLKEIEMGGMAAVYLAKARGIGGFEKFLAIKRIFPQLSRSEDFVEMFITEARIACELNHPNISHIYDLGQEDGDYFIAMEYIHGKDAFRLLRRCKHQARTIPIPLACYITQQILLGLDYAHRKRDHSGNPMMIVHRDVSPRNVLISYEGQVKLIDFGIAKASVQNSHTRAGTIKGKVNYMSPEQARGEEIDGRSDLFSAGLLLYELLFQAKLFKGNTEIHTLELIKECQLPDFRKEFPELPEELEQVLLKSLARDRNQRYAHAQEFLQDLNQYLSRYSTVAGGVWLSEFMQDCFAPEIAGEQRELETYRGVGEDPLSQPGLNSGLRSTGGTPPPATLVQPMPDQARGARQTVYSGAAVSAVLSGSPVSVGARGAGSAATRGTAAPSDVPDDLAAGDLQTSVEIQTGQKDIQDEAVATRLVTPAQETAAIGNTSATVGEAKATATATASASAEAPPIQPFGSSRAVQRSGMSTSFMALGAVAVLALGGLGLWLTQGSKDAAGGSSEGASATLTSASAGNPGNAGSGSDAAPGAASGEATRVSPAPENSQPSTGSAASNLAESGGGSPADSGVSPGESDTAVASLPNKRPTSAATAGAPGPGTEAPQPSSKTGTSRTSSPSAPPSGDAQNSAPPVVAGAAAPAAGASGVSTTASGPSTSGASSGAGSAAPTAMAAASGTSSASTSTEKSADNSGDKPDTSRPSTGSSAPATRPDASATLEPKPSTDVRSFGFLNVNATAPCLVRVDGAVIGKTPLIKTRVGIGARKVELENLTDHSTRTYDLNVKAQQVHTVLWKGGE